MPYIAHVGIQLSKDYISYEKNRWFFIKKSGEYNYHWRLNSNGIYEVVCELFDNKEIALFTAKNIFVTALYNLLYKGIAIADAGCQFYEKTLFIPELDGSREDYPESSFFWTPKRFGGGIGVDVYEVPESFEDFDKIYSKKFFQNIKISVTTTASVLDFDNFEKSYFIYSKITQPLLYTIIQADTVFEIGLQMTLYCGLLEHLADDKQKNPDVLTEIDSLVDHVMSSDLSKDEKKSLVHFLQSGKKVSARQKCNSLCQQYAKEHYGHYSRKQILDDAYSIRSIFSHGEDCSNRYTGPAPYIKLVVRDVLFGYMKDHDNNHP